MPAGTKNGQIRLRRRSAAERGRRTRLPCGRIISSGDSPCMVLFRFRVRRFKDYCLEAEVRKPSDQYARESLRQPDNRNRALFSRLGSEVPG